MSNHHGHPVFPEKAAEFPVKRLPGPTNQPVLVDHALSPHGRLDVAQLVARSPEVAEGGQAHVLVVALSERGGGHAGRVVGLVAVGQAILGMINKLQSLLYLSFL